MGINRCTDSARRNVGLGQPGAETYSERSRSARLLVIVAAVAIVALFALFWQQSNPLQPAFAGAGDATGPVTITGTAEVGRTLTADTFQVGDTDGITNVSYTYAWYSGGAVVDGETESAYDVLARDMQQSIYVVVTFEDDASNAERLQSAAVGPVPTVQNNEATGTVEIIHILTTEPLEVHDATHGFDNINDNDGQSVNEYRWQWLRNGQPIDGATDVDRYVVTADDIGSRISLRLQFTDLLGFEEEFVSDETDPVPSGPVIRATGDYYFDDNDATVETLTVDLSRLNYTDMPTNRSYTYVWEYVGAEGDVTDTTFISPIYDDGMGGQIDRGDGYNSGATFTLTSADAGKHIQVEVTILDAGDSNANWGEKYANRATPAITMRPPIEAPENVVANVPSGGGSVTLNWGLTSLGGAQPTSFQYRYRPTVLLSTSPFMATDWIALAGGGTRSVTVPGGLINNAAYTFEVRSKIALVDGVAESVEATYLHRTRSCS